jgi:mitochondrial fission protein ELM1
MNRALVVWQWTDGKRGHERQCEGLLEALADRTPLEHHRLPVPASPLTRLIDVVRGVLPAWRHLPAPHLVLGAGRACVLPMLATRRARGGRTVYLMRPQLPTACFDLCIVPRHDGLRAGPHVEVSEGPLNPMRAGAERDATLGVVLVGGPSGHHGWHTEGLLAQLAVLLRHAPRMRWVVSDSRRSPPDLERALAAYPGIEFHSHRDTPVDWLPGLLARAAEVWVSADSVSMIYEALGAGARVGVLEVPARRDDRITAIAADLHARGLVMKLSDEASLRNHEPPLLREADRFADLILARWPLAVTPS